MRWLCGRDEKSLSLTLCLPFIVIRFMKNAKFNFHYANYFILALSLLPTVILMKTNGRKGRKDIFSIQLCGLRKLNFFCACCTLNFMTCLFPSNRVAAHIASRKRWKAKLFFSSFFPPWRRREKLGARFKVEECSFYRRLIKFGASWLKWASSSSFRVDRRWLCTFDYQQLRRKTFHYFFFSTRAILSPHRWVSNISKWLKCKAKTYLLKFCR
jgi:hypothetical protein